MINFFPRRYPDELLYSVISRYKEQSGISSKKAIARALFETDTYRLSTLLTQNIDTLVSNLPKSCLLTAENIIKENTLFPFYTVFINNEKREEVYLAMKQADRKSIEARLGIKNWQCNSHPMLKYCPLCYKNDMEVRGESYWSRLFQLPGVLICPWHKVGLKKSGIWTNNLQLEYECPNELICNHQYETLDDRVTELNMGYVKNCMKLLDQLYKNKDALFFRDFYVDKLRTKGLASIHGSIYMQELLEEFKVFYGREYLNLMKSDFVVEDKSNWIRVFVRTTKKNRSPLRHLLLLQFLDTEVSEVFSCINVQGKVAVYKKHIPMLNREERRERWLKLLEENPEASRNRLKEKAGGLHTWLFRNDREWYESVTPLYKVKPDRGINLDYKLLDQQSLPIVKRAVYELLNNDKKPTRITYNAIKRQSGLDIQLKNEKYPLTYAYIESAIEDIKSFRIRKIRWAINEIYKEGNIPTEYKVQLKAGFGGTNDMVVRQLINVELERQEKYV